MKRIADLTGHQFIEEVEKRALHNLHTTGPDNVTPDEEIVFKAGVLAGALAVAELLNEAEKS